MAEKPMTRAPAGPPEWWVRHQDEDVTVVQAHERPPTDVQRGERRIAIRGPYRTRDLAEQVRTAIEQRTLRWLVAQGR